MQNSEPRKTGEPSWGPQGQIRRHPECQGFRWGSTWEATLISLLISCAIFSHQYLLYYFQLGKIWRQKINPEANFSGIRGLSKTWFAVCVHHHTRARWTWLESHFLGWFLKVLVPQFLLSFAFRLSAFPNKLETLNICIDKESHLDQTLLRLPQTPQLGLDFQTSMFISASFKFSKNPSKSV